MRRLACILLMAVLVSGCSMAGRAYDQYPMAKGGWSVNWSPMGLGFGLKEPTAEFACGSYKYRLERGIWVSDYHWFGPAFLPIFPPFLAGAGSDQVDGREFFLDMHGKHADTFVCPIIKMDGEAYKTSPLHDGEDFTRCLYDIPTPKDTLAFTIEDQMGCKVPPLEFKLTPHWYYVPIFPNTGYQ